MLDQLEAVGRAIADPSRLRILKMLEGGELCVCQITGVLGLAPATVSRHLALLRQAGLVTQRKAGRWVHYRLAACSANVHAAAMLELIGAALETDPTIGGDRARLAGIRGMPLELLCARDTRSPAAGDPPGQGVTLMDRKPYNVLFLCTGNSARSIMAECALIRFGTPRFRAFSAGSHPKGEVLPETLALLKRLNYATAGLRSKSWEEFTGDRAPELDFVFTVCDNARGETCPIWPGQPMTAHWGVDDPAAVEGPADKRDKAFRRAYFELENRIKIFSSLRLEGLDRLSLQNRLNQIGTTVSPAEAGGESQTKQEAGV